jgi:hypothetical protein
VGQSLAQEIDLSPGTSPACPEVSPGGCPRLRVPGRSLSLNGEIALGYLALGYRPIPLIQDDNGSWIPAIKWGPFQHRAPTRQEVVNWWMTYANAGIAQVCGREAGQEVLDVDPRHGGVDPKLSAPACSTPRGGIHYHFVAPASIPELAGPGMEWLGDGHIARVPPTPGYRWLNGGLSPRKACYETEQLPLASRPREPISRASVPSEQGNLCDILSHALGKDIRPCTCITCFCHHDEVPSLAIYPDHAYCFSQRKWFSPHQVLEGLGLAHLFHIEAGRQLYEVNVHGGSVRSIAPTGVRLAEEKGRLTKGLKELGFIDKAKEVEMCGQWVTRERSEEVKTRTCEDCGATFVVQSRCHYRFCPECAAIEARNNLRGKEAVFKNARCVILRLPLPSVPDTTRAAFVQEKKRASATLRRLLGRGCGPAYHKFLTGCRNGEFRWELVVLVAEVDIANLEAEWPYGSAGVVRGLTPAQAVALYLEVAARPPEWRSPEDMATLDTMLFRQRVTGSHGSAHGNSRAMREKPRAPKVVQHCPVCGSSNLGRPVYRDAAGVRRVNSIPLWFPPSLGPPYHDEIQSAQEQKQAQIPSREVTKWPEDRW